MEIKFAASLFQFPIESRNFDKEVSLKGKLFKFFFILFHCHPLLPTTTEPSSSHSSTEKMKLNLISIPKAVILIPF